MGNLLSYPPPSVAWGCLTAILVLTVILRRWSRWRAEQSRKDSELVWFSDLHFLSKASEESLEPPQMADLALRLTLKILGMTEGYVLLQTPQPDEVTYTHAQGLSASTVSQLNSELLQPYLASCGERWGSLMIFPDLSSSSLVATWQRDSLFQEFRLVLLSEGLKSLVVVGLHVRGKSYGVFLAGSRGRRAFTPLELRLVLAGGNQMSVALENWALHRAAERHNEELRNLRQVGEALRATVDLESQVEILQRELKRFLGVLHFSLALQNSPDGPLEGVMAVQDSGCDGPVANLDGSALAQYVVRTRAPLRIAGDVPNVTSKLGLGSIDPRLRSWCGVPIRFSDGSMGVLEAADLEDGRAISDRQFEMLQLLANEVSGAIENARTFQNEQRRACHLALLNDLGRKATAVLNAQELLPSICREVRDAFGYELARIEVSDSEHSQLVVEAESGYGAELLGRRVAYGEGLSGAAAESREPVLADTLLEGPYRAPLHASARSALSLPLKFGEELLGVLSLESRRAHAFSQQDVLTLRTLVDQLAIALHNARAYQVAIDQAITDGVTGLKTHRYFMEALNREWRRSTRSGRIFSLIMMDLDRFKLVNDRRGHLEGDKVLAAVAFFLTAHTRQSNIVARYGGDEFAVLMPEANIEQALTLAERLCVGLPLDSALAPHGLTGSFGIASFPVHGPTPEEVLRVADSGMYLAKHQDGNCVRVLSLGSQSQQAESEQQVLEAHLGVALRRMFSTGPDVFDHYLERFEQIKQNGAREALSLLDMLTALAFFIDAKDQNTQGHCYAVSRLAKQIARQVGLGEAEVEEVGLAGILHDIGKIGIPEEVLFKPTTLTSDEYDVVKTHTMLAGRLLDLLTVKSADRIRQMVRHHHEYFNGRGYPEKLKGDQIPLGARILSVADSFDTMVSERAYKKVFSVEEAIGELRRCCGRQFDPILVDAFIQSLEALGDPRKRAAVEEAAN